MSGVKPTPGPWSVRRESAIDYRPNCIVGADGGSLVAWCAGGGPKRAVMGPEEDANARLIAAAPELLEVLTGLIEWVEGEQPEFNEDPEWPEFQARVYAVMRKARGSE